MYKCMCWGWGFLLIPCEDVLHVLRMWLCCMCVVGGGASMYLGVLGAGPSMCWGRG